jgi:hypothetical protein
MAGANTIPAELSNKVVKVAVKVLLAAENGFFMEGFA